MNGIATLIPKWVLNLRDKIGNTDISDVGNGTVTGAVAQLNNDLTEKVQLNDIPSSSQSVTVTSTKSYTVTKSGFVFAVTNIEDNNHTIRYTRNGNNAQVGLTTKAIPYPVCVGDIITIQGTSSYASYIYPCGCFDI